MAGFLQANFLIPSVVARRMKGMNLALAAGNFLSEPGAGGQSRIRAGATELFAEILESLDPERLGGQVKAGLKTQLDKLEISPLLGQMLAAAIADKRHLPLLESALRWAGITLEANEDLVRDMIHKRANALLRLTGFDERLANSVLDGLYKLIAECIVDPDHPLRQKLEEGLENLAHDLANDPEMRAKVEGIKRGLLDNAAVGDWRQGVWERLRHSLIETARNPDAALAGQLGGALSELGKALARRSRAAAAGQSLLPADPRSVSRRATAGRSSSWFRKP